MAADLSSITGSDHLLIYKYSVSALVIQSSISYFSNGKLITCDEDKQCRRVTTATESGKYYVNAGATALSDALYRCSGTTTVTCSAVTAVDGGNYLDATNPANVIHCTTEDKCVSSPGETGGQVYIDALLTGGKKLNIITCDVSDGCSSSVAITTGQAYIDAVKVGGNFSNVIVCTTNGCTSGTGSASTTGQAYIDAIKVSGKFSKVITCTGSVCTSSSGSTTTGQAYINAIESGGNNPNVITCTADDCTSGSGASNTYTDAITTANTITCNGTTCTSAPTDP